MMFPSKRSRLTLFCRFTALVVVVGCESHQVKTTPPTETQESAADNIPVSDQRKAVAEKAKDALFMRLSARLMEVMQSEGPAAAINICSQEAVTLAKTVGQEYGLQIGRTSFKLRNPTNAPKKWMQEYVDKRTDTPQHVLLDDGSLGSLFPIQLNVNCLMCHGQPDDILDAVKPELAKLYPNDAATGFKLGDLRGWFWTEVPAPVDETHSLN